MRRTARLLVAYSVASFIIDRALRRWAYRRTAYYRWHLGWGGRLGPWCWAFRPQDLPRLEPRWDQDGGRAFYGLDFGVEGCDPILSLIWEPRR